MKRSITRFALLFLAVVSVNFAFAQTGVKGKITDSYGEPLPGASVMEKGTTAGGISDFEGMFKVELSAGSKEIQFSFVGYDTKIVSVEVSKGQMTNMGTVKLAGSTIGLGSIEIVADRAKERETPVAFANISKKEIEEQLGSQDIPLVMNLTPSVYSTPGGGGAGDARINVRGFNQRNVAIMINGVPVNDMENGWVYWSNWDGMADATSSIQMQRGLSAVNLATPSIGGTMNIITSPAEHKAGGSAKFEYGSGNFMKTTVSGNSGLINDKFAVSASIVRKIGDGIIDGTWTDAWAYYLGASYKINDKNRLEAFVMGAPQRHGQNLYRQNVAAYGHDIAKDLGADDALLENVPEAGAGRYYNENWNNVSSSYSGKQWWNGKEHDRYSKDILNERENFYHKPLINLNWYSQLTEKANLFTVLYYSGGTGGGSGTYGHLNWNYDSPSRIADWDATIAENQTNEDGAASGILRNSVNDQWQIGAISKLRLLVTDNLKVQVGVDWRYAEIDHFREVRDLLGASYFYYDGNDFDSEADYKKGLGDKIAYHFTNTVGWYGGFAQAEYSTDKFTAFGTFGASTIKYTYTNHFTKADDGGELYAEVDPILGWQLKGGASYRPMPLVNVFANFGLISKAPIFDNVIDDYSGSIAEDPKNENFTAFEVGAEFNSIDDKINVKANYYYTLWTDRANSRGIQTQDGKDAIVFLTGMEELHKGIELEASYQPIKQLGFGALASFGNWTYRNDVKGDYREFDETTSEWVVTEYSYYTDGLKVGDMPQQQIAGLIQIFPVKGARIQADFRHYSKHFADWDPFSRTDETDAAQVWETPAYMLVDLHFGYSMNLKEKYNIEFFGHVFNLLDEVYIQDATDNSHYNGFYGENNEFSHTINSAEVYLGLPRRFNVGVKFTF